MSSYLNLPSVPMELMEVILTSLDLPDICSLRLTTREVAAKASQGKFKTFFRNKKINLASVEQLEEAIYMTERNRLGCFVDHLTLVRNRVAVDGDSQEHDAAELLGQAMKNLRLFSVRGFLSSLFLTVEGISADSRVAGVMGGGWSGREELPSTWEAAAKCFQTAAQALGTSGLPIESLDAFGRVNRCSLFCDQIATMLGKVDLSTSFKGLKRLSMSLSNHEIQEPRGEITPSSTTGQQYSNAICHFIQLCPALEDLQLHWFRLRTSHNMTDAQLEEYLEEKRFFNRVAETCRLPSLKKIALKGIYTSGAALLSILRQVQLTSFEMEEIQLHSGNFRPVFDYLVKEMEHLEHVHLDDLWEQRLINFDAPGKPHFPSSGRRKRGPNMITRSGADARQPIKYIVHYSGHALGSPACARWRREKKIHYGPL